MGESVLGVLKDAKPCISNTGAPLQEHDSQIRSKFNNIVHGIVGQILAVGDFKFHKTGFLAQDGA